MHTEIERSSEIVCKWKVEFQKHKQTNLLKKFFIYVIILLIAINLTKTQKRGDNFYDDFTRNLL